MTGRTSRLDGRQRTRHAVLSRLGRDLGWRGEPIENLDALYDVLVRELRGPLRIEWRPSPSARLALGDDLERIAKVLRAAAAERDDLSVDLPG